MQRQVGPFLHTLLSKPRHSPQRRDESSLPAGDAVQQTRLERESPFRSSLIHRLRNSSLDDRRQEASKLVATEDCRDETKHSFSAREMHPSIRAWRKRSLSGIQPSMDPDIPLSTNGELKASQRWPPRTAETNPGSLPNFVTGQKTLSGSCVFGILMDSCLVKMVA